MNETIFIGVGTAEDPFPEHPNPTRFRLCSAPCPRCNWAERYLRQGATQLVLLCGQCGATTELALNTVLWPEITFVFWCTKSRFDSDRVEPGSPLEQELARILEKFEPVVCPPAWGVLVVAGTCQKSDQCRNTACPYRVESQPRELRPIERTSSPGRGDPITTKTGDWPGNVIRLPRRKN